MQLQTLNIQMPHGYSCKRLPEASWAMLDSSLGWRRSERKQLILCHALPLCAFGEIFIRTQFSCCTSSDPDYLPLTCSNGAGTGAGRAVWAGLVTFRLAGHTGLECHHNLTAWGLPAWRPSWLFPHSNQGWPPAQALCITRALRGSAFR